MLPIGDENIRGGRPAILTLLLIALNVLAFVMELTKSSPGALQAFIQAWGMVPRELTAGQDLPPTIPVPVWTTALTSMFLHGGWMHLGGNMLYLWIFGDNLEKVMGPVKFLIFYLLCGFAAAAAHVLSSPGSTVPTVGASGAISGVLGGYLLLFPRNRIRVLTRGGVAQVPAILVLGLWIVIQLFSSLGSLAQTADTGGVAFLAHVGGFVAGLILVKPFAAGYRSSASVAEAGP
jgi:membrane associated rhomboid family serine protease